MKKTGKILSAFLALVMAVALAIPVFADGEELISLAESGCSYTVAPVGIARIYLSDGDWEECAVFDREVTFTLKNGEFHYSHGDEVLNPDGSVTLPADAEYGYLMFEDDRGAYVFSVCSKSFVDKIMNGGGFLNDTNKMEYIPNGNSAAPIQPSVPSQPSTPSTTVQKPAPGKSVPLNDGSGEFLYTVKYGDSLRGLAAYYYGSSSVYKLIYERNKSSLRSADAIYAGQTIILPSYAAVAKGVASVASATPAVSSTSIKPAPGVSVALNDGSGEFAYTIKYGDSLKGIAAYYYGNANVYKLIYERNKSTLRSADMIYAGQTIILPSYAAVAQGVARI